MSNPYEMRKNAHDLVEGEHYTKEQYDELKAKQLAELKELAKTYGWVWANIQKQLAEDDDEFQYPIW